MELVKKMGHAQNYRVLHNDYNAGMISTARKLSNEGFEGGGRLVWPTQP